MYRTALVISVCLLLSHLVDSEAKAVSVRYHDRHPVLLNHENTFGVPTDGCLTYQERYRHAFKSTPTKRANAPQGHHNFAILSWGLWHGEPFPQDLLASLRVLALEGHAAGFDVWFLYRVPTGGSLTLEDHKRVFPPDLQELVVVWDPEEVFAMYSAIPDVPVFQKDLKDPMFWDYQSSLGYIPSVWFMHRFGAYDFSFQLESDIRYTGDWGKLLASALNIAMASEAPDWQARPEGPGFAIAAQAASTELPTDLTGLPDLINFLPIVGSDKWKWKSVNISEPLYESLFMLWGGSRKLFEAMHNWSRQGKAVFYESFMATVAANHKMKMVAVDHPVYESDEQAGEHTWHCCTVGGRDIYVDWFKSKHCLHPFLMHPVKLSEDAWVANSYEKWMQK